MTSVLIGRETFLSTQGTGEDNLWRREASEKPALLTAGFTAFGVRNSAV